MKNTKNSVVMLLIFALAAFILSSCGSGGSGGSAQSESGSAGTGSVAIVLTDNFTDEFSKIIVTITKIELLSDRGKYTVFSGSRRFDFLNLRNETALMVMKDSVPAMWYEKIRLTVEAVELYDANGLLIQDKPVNLTGNKKIDLNPRRHFYVATGKMITITLDLDAQNSFILNENKNGYKFDPVIFIEITGNLPPAKLLRVSGIIHDINAADGEFTLCFLEDDFNLMHYDDGNCLTVSVSRNTSLFDEDTKGRPISFTDLEVRDGVTVIGSFSRTLCAQYGDDYDSCKVLDAVVIERGDFEKIKGTVLSPVDMTAQPYTFDLQLDPGQLPVAGGQIKVLLQDTTKIFSVKLGELVNAGSLQPGDPVEIDGIALDSIPDPLNEPDIVNAVFILVDLAKKLSGTIMNTDYQNLTFDLHPVNTCVFVPDYAQVYLIRNLDNASDIIDIMGLLDGMQADVYGYEYDGSGCLKAKTIIAFE